MTSTGSEEGALEWAQIPSGTVLRAGHPLHREIVDLGVLHLDRPLPFLCVYREPSDRDDPGMKKLIVSEASYLDGTGAAESQQELSELVEEVVAGFSQRFGGFLILELWSATADSGEAVIRVEEQRGRAPRSTVERLVDSLREMRVKGQHFAVTHRRVDAPAPPGLPPLLDGATLRRLGCALVGVEVPAIFRGEGGVYPFVLRELHRGLTHALRATLAEFLRAHTSEPVTHFLSLGPHCVGDLVGKIDKSLSRVERSFDFLMQITPVNARAAKAQFFDAGACRPPHFVYRPVTIDPDLLKRTLYDLPIERIGDPVMEELFLEKRQELSRRLGVLDELGKRSVLYASLQLWGEPDDQLLAAAREILVEPLRPPRERDELVSAAEVAARAEEIIEGYQREVPEIRCRVEIADDLVGCTVSHGNVFLADDTTVPRHRLDALLAHEIETHVLTYINGRLQPFQLLSTGLVGYDELQEGLGVLAEHFCDGLTLSRLRLLAGRVVAARAIAEGADFVDTYRLLTATHGFSDDEAFGITMRIYRGGGMVKDAIYLRGLLFLLEHLQGGGELAPLFVGKIAPAHRGLMRELRLRGLLVPPRLLPSYLERPDARRKLLRLREGMQLRDLVSVA